MVVAATKELMPELKHIGVVFVVESTPAGLKASTTKAKHPPRTASHKPAKIATTRGSPLNTARVRKKKRRDDNTRTAQ